MSIEQMQYAGFWVRTGATIIDSLLELIIIVPLLILIYGLDYYTSEYTNFIAGPADFLISWVFPLVAAVWFWVKLQATPGKMAVSLKVVDARTGNSLSVAQAIGRYFAYFLSAVPLGLGFIWIAFDSKKQGWHDKLAGTVVIRTHSGAPEPVRFEQPPAA
jgi:uncharacterized RDD family membrane protein YckC